MRRYWDVYILLVCMESECLDTLVLEGEQVRDRRRKFRYSWLTTALKRAVSDLGSLDVVVYNVKPSTIGEHFYNEMIKDFEVASLSLYAMATVPMPHLQRLARSNPAAHPGLFVTLNIRFHRPPAPVFSLSMTKAAQASLVKALAEENKGVLPVGLVTVGR